MRDLIPSIELQEILARQLYQSLQGDVIGAVRYNYLRGSDVTLHSKMKGHSLPVKENILPELYTLCEEVKKKLEFYEPIDFYVTGRSEVNACAIASEDIEQQPHIIEINSALFNLMSTLELQYVIGHEVGHLINHDSAISGLYHYIYPTEELKEKVPKFVSARYELWERIAELSADRYGYMACENLDACVTAIFKLASGLHLDRMNIRFTDLMDLNGQNLDFFLNENMSFGGTHPVNPIRIQALNLFVKAKTQKALKQGMLELIGLLDNPFEEDEVTEACASFYAAAGLYMCSKNNKLEKRAEEFVLNAVARCSLNPFKVLKDTVKSDYMEVMKESISTILHHVPAQRVAILCYLIDIAFIDDLIEIDEVKRIYETGIQLGFDADEISDALTSKIRQGFQPQAFLMK